MHCTVMYCIAQTLHCIVLHCTISVSVSIAKQLHWINGGVRGANGLQLHSHCAGKTISALHVEISCPKFVGEVQIILRLYCCAVGGSNRGENQINAKSQPVSVLIKPSQPDVSSLLEPTFQFKFLQFSSYLTSRHLHTLHCKGSNSIKIMRLAMST